MSEDDDHIPDGSRTLAAEYVLAQSNPNVIFCERGIRTFENQTRNTFDIAAVPVVQKLSHLPIFVDPSHAAGKRPFIGALSLAGVAAGADGLMLEVHPNPDHALSDGQQSLNFDEFAELMPRLAAVAKAVDRSVATTGECSRGVPRAVGNSTAGAQVPPPSEDRA